MFKETGLVTDRKNYKLEENPLGLPCVRDGHYHVFNQYVIRARERDKLKAFLNQHGIGCGIYYPLPIHLQPCYQENTDFQLRYQQLGLSYKEGSFPEAERAAREVLALPIYPELTEGQQELVVSTISQFYKKR